MKLTLAFWQMRFSVIMDEVLNLWLFGSIMLCTHAVSKRFFFRILIPAYVARNICHSANTNIFYYGVLKSANPVPGVVTILLGRARWKTLC